MSDTDDYVAIIRLQQRYSRAVDGRDWPVAAGCFHTGSQANYRGNRVQGPEGIIGHIRSVIERFEVTQHLTGSPQLDLDGDRAVGDTYVVANHVVDCGARQCLVGARYDDELVRLPEGWRFQERRTTILWFQGDIDLLRIG